MTDTHTGRGKRYILLYATGLVKNRGAGGKLTRSVYIPYTYTFKVGWAKGKQLFAKRHKKAERARQAIPFGLSTALMATLEKSPVISYVTGKGPQAGKRLPTHFSAVNPIHTVETPPPEALR